MTLREYLLSTSLLVESPYQQVGLAQLEKISCADSSPKLINGYRTKDQKVFCHVCGGHRHQHGLTAQLSDGSLILFGRTCAEKFFGPKIWEKCWGEFKRAQDLAFARYRILNLTKLCEPISAWVKSNRHRVLKAKETWNQIQVQHEQFFAELQTELKRNSGRITETDDVVVTSDMAAAGFRGSYSTTSIITSVRGHQSFPHLGNLDKELIIIESFLSAISDMPSDLNDQQILEYSRRLERNVRPSARRIDEALILTADILSEDKLGMVGAWSDRKRMRALRHLAVVTPRNIAETIRKTCGFGYEAPSISSRRRFPTCIVRSPN